MSRHSAATLFSFALFVASAFMTPFSEGYATIMRPLRATSTKLGGHILRRDELTIGQNIHIANYKPLPPSDDDPLDVRCALLHISARKAIKSGKITIARRFYELFVYQWSGEQTDACVAHTYFLWALLEQRAKDYHKARQVFQEATTRYPTHARLLQAWALMESKCGQLEEARRLIAQAVEHDRSLQPVLKWKLWNGGDAAAAAAVSARAMA